MYLNVSFENTKNRNCLEMDVDVVQILRFLGLKIEVLEKKR